MWNTSSLPNDPGNIAFAPEISERFARALGAALHKYDQTMRELRSALCACVDELKGRGMESEQVLAAMKEYVRRTAITHPPGGGPGSRGAAEHLMDDIVHWCILDYYRPR
jgi:hypothetical protein